MKKKLCVMAVAALVIWGVKRHYADARADDLWWILTPTAHVVGTLTGTAFVAVPSEGHVSHERLFVIEKSCAGINFMVAAFGMLVFALLHRVRSGLSGLCVLGASSAGELWHGDRRQRGAHHDRHVACRSSGPRCRRSTRPRSIALKGSWCTSRDWCSCASSRGESTAVPAWPRGLPTGAYVGNSSRSIMSEGWTA